MNHRTDEFELSGGDRFVQPLKKPVTKRRVSSQKAERMQLAPDIPLVKDNLIVPEEVQLELL